MAIFLRGGVYLSIYPSEWSWSFYLDSFRSSDPRRTHDALWYDITNISWRKGKSARSAFFEYSCCYFIDWTYDFTLLSRGSALSSPSLGKTKRRQTEWVTPWSDEESQSAAHRATTQRHSAESTHLIPFVARTALKHTRTLLCWWNRFVFWIDSQMVMFI